MKTSQTSPQERYTITLDDDPVVYKLIEKYLGIRSIPFTSATDLVKSTADYQPIGAFIDINLGSGETGLEIISELRRAWRYIPIFVITASQTETAVISALSSGADDFIRKPINAEELKFRFSLRQKDAEEKQATQVLHFADITIDLLFGSIQGNGHEIYLSSSDLNLIVGLLRTGGTVMAREAMKRLVWGRISVSEMALDRRIHIVRKAIEEVSQVLECITIYGKGLMIIEKAGKKETPYDLTTN